MRILHCRMRIRRELEYKYEICCNVAGDEYELETCLGAGAVGASLALGRALVSSRADPALPRTSYRETKMQSDRWKKSAMGRSAGLNATKG